MGNRLLDRALYARVCAAFVLLVVALALASQAFPAYAETATDKEANRIAVDLFGQDEGYSAVLYDNTNGLPTSEANAIAETSEGFIWIGSYSGLIRFDGHSFERVDSTTGIASVVSMYVDSSGRLWVGTNDSGVAVMEHGAFTMIKKADGLGSSSVRSIVEDASGIMYIATTNGISTIGRDMVVTPLDDSRLKSAYVRELRASAAGEVVGVTMGGDVFVMRDGRVQGFYGEADLGVSGIISVLPDPDREGFVYLGTSSSDVFYGKLSYDLADFQAIDVAPLVSVKSMEEYQGRLIVCADNGVGAVEDGTFKKVENVPLDDSIDHAMLDYEGNLWFTSSRQGVMKVVPNQFADVFERYGLPAAVVNSTCWLNGRLFIGTDSGLTVIDENGPVASVPLEKAATAGGKDLEQADLIGLLSGQRIRSIIRDSKDRLWFSTYGPYGLVSLHDGVATCFTSDDGMPSSRVRTVAELSDGAVLAVCTGGVARIDQGRVATVYGNDSGIDNIEILTACEAPNGDVILGSDGDGMYIVHDGALTRIGTEQGLSSDVVMRVKHSSSRDVFWIVTSNSIAFMDEEYNITTLRDFPYSNNFDLYENSQGDVWVLSSNGIYVTAVDDLLANGEILPEYYGRANGLPVIATANSYSDITEEGDLYIAGSTGVAKVNIEVPFERVSDIKTAVPFVEADGKFLYADENGTFEIPAETSKLTVYPFVFTYSLMNPQVTYQLEGFNQGAVTVNADELDPVDFTNLHGGTYRFVMQLHDTVGDGGSELDVAIAKPETVWETLWFRVFRVIAAAAVLAFFAWLYFRRKTNQIKEKERESRLLIREIAEAFARVIDMKDHYTNGHSTRVAEYTVLLARELGYDEETVEKYYNIALLHDIGKIGVPSRVLNKEGKLTDEEFALMKSHASLGYDALKDISIMPELAVGAGSHHERPDGKGYPLGLTGDEIPRVAQVIAVADTFDAMYSDRPYRKRMNFERVVSIISEGAGTQLTPDVVDAFLRLVEKGEFRHPDDKGGGTTENIENVK